MAYSFNDPTLPFWVLPWSRKRRNNQDPDSHVTSQSTTAEVKALLMKNSDEAFAEGAFGLPWWVATNREGKKECFWGFDHTKQVIRHLGLDETTDSETGGWRAML